MKVADRVAAPTDSRPRRSGRITALVAVAGALAVFILANAHLIYVAVQSHPGCVPHQNATAAQAPRVAYSAAQSAC